MCCCHSALQNYYLAMVSRTYESDAAKIEDVDDLDDLGLISVKLGEQLPITQEVGSVGIRSV